MCTVLVARNISSRTFRNSKLFDSEFLENLEVLVKINTFITNGSKDIDKVFTLKSNKFNSLLRISII